MMVARQTASERDASASRSPSPEKVESPPETVPQYLGLSSDGRTNRWRVTCPACGYPEEPPTTLRACQALTCPACQAESVADYNVPIVRLLSSPS